MAGSVDEKEAPVAKVVVAVEAAFDGAPFVSTRAELSKPRMKEGLAGKGRVRRLGPAWRSSCVGSWANYHFCAWELPTVACVVEMEVAVDDCIYSFGLHRSGFQNIKTVLWDLWFYQMVLELCDDLGMVLDILVVV